MGDVARMERELKAKILDDFVRVIEGLVARAEKLHGNDPQIATHIRRARIVLSQGHLQIFEVVAPAIARHRALADVPDAEFDLDELIAAARADPAFEAAGDDGEAGISVLLSHWGLVTLEDRKHGRRAARKIAGFWDEWVECFA
jgi:hypothetical protein